MQTPTKRYMEGEKEGHVMMEAEREGSGQCKELLQPLEEGGVGPVAS